MNRTDAMLVYHSFVTTTARSALARARVRGEGLRALDALFDAYTAARDVGPAALQAALDDALQHVLRNMPPMPARAPR